MERHSKACKCERAACRCEPLELDYVIYMDDRLLEQTYHQRYTPRVICIQCEVARRDNNLRSMKRLRRARLLQQSETSGSEQTTLTEPDSGDDSLPELTETDDDGGPLEEDLNNIRPPPIVCSHAHDREVRAAKPLAVNHKPLIQAVHEHDERFVYLEPLPSDVSSPSDSDAEPVAPSSGDTDGTLSVMTGELKLTDDHQPNSGGDSDNDTKEEHQQQHKAKRKRKWKKKKPSEESPPAETAAEAAASREQTRTKKRADIRSEIMKTFDMHKSGQHLNIKIRQRAEAAAVRRGVAERLQIDETAQELSVLEEYMTDNPEVAYLLDIKGFNSRLQAFSELKTPVTNEQEIEQSGNALAELKGYIQGRVRKAIGTLPMMDDNTRRELQRMSRRMYHVVDVMKQDYEETKEKVLKAKAIAKSGGKK